MYIFLIILIVLVSILLAFVVLIQKSKGGGLASNFSASNQIMGVRKTTDFLEKSTWTLAAAVVVLSVLTAYTVPSTQAAKSVLQKENMQQPAANPMNTKGFAAPQATDGSTPAATGTNAPAAEAPASPAQQPAAETPAAPQAK
ncbi:MAG: preprotein translocase subunit SecG [Bacteroidaceae bacterium]|jgi:preprotein translocase subunit SecG